MSGFVAFRPAARPIPRHGLPPVVRQVASFGVIGVVSTGAYVALYALLRPVMHATTANAVALLVTAVGNTAANRRLTFAKRGNTGALRDQAAGLLALGVALVITTAAVTLLGAVAPGASRAAELGVLVAANILATLCRFVLLRAMIARTTASPSSRTGAIEQA